MFKEHKIIMLPTNDVINGSHVVKCIKYFDFGYIEEEEGTISYRFNDSLIILSEDNKDWQKEHYQSQHLYIISDEPIKKGDWFLELDLKGTRSSYCKKPYLCDIGNTGGFILTHQNGNFPFPENCVKIIATTDKNLNISLIPDSFIQDYCSLQACNNVFIEYLRGSGGYYDDNDVWHWDILGIKRNPYNNSIYYHF